jgi:hypothetical protein
MLLDEYLTALNELVKKYPNLKDAEVIYSKDDEGNSYHKVNYTPTPTVIKGECHHECDIEPLAYKDQWIKANGLIIN